MFKRTLSLVMLFLVIGLYAYAQDNSTGLVPASDRHAVGPIIPQGPTSLTTRGLSYQSTSLTASTLFKYFVGTPASPTVVGAVQPYFFGNGDWANPTGVWKFYVMEQVVGPYNIYEVDTATGTTTLIGGVSGLNAGESPIMLEWNHVTNQFYVFSSTSAVSSGQLYSMNWTTRVCTPIGPANTTSPGLIAGGINSGGNTLFGYDLVNDNIWKCNLTTGISTLVGTSGYLGNYGQDGGFDRSDWKLYWAACGGVVGLREIDTTTGMSTQIGTFPYTQVIATGFAASAGPSIVHTPLPNTTNLAGPYIVNAQIIPAGSAITYAKVFWSRNNPVITDSVTMTTTSGNNWTGNIPGNGTAATYRYYIKGMDALNRVVTHPGNAPATLNTFIATSTDTTKPVITHTPIGNTPRVTWPVAVNCTATDPFGVGTVTVRWRNSRTNITKAYNLTNSSGNNWSGPFNSDTTEVLIGDSIYYRIIATDASPQLNKDSTALYAFKIIQPTNICIGTGTTTIGWPYYTFYMDSRWNGLYLASEITASGGSAGMVSQIGFNIATVGSPSMAGFNVRLQGTSATTISGFLTSGWTTVYTNAAGYTPPGTGWQYITFSTPFYWNGTSNLAVEICFNNAAWSANSTVYGTASSLNVHQYQDISAGDGCVQLTAGTVQATRPNACFTIGLVGVHNPSTEVPSVYKLSQNYPNPFNPVTQIKYDLPKQGLVTLRVYDVLGREVTKLVNEVKSPGSYIVDFDGTNISSGVYFYKLEVNGFSDVKRMVLIK